MENDKKIIFREDDFQLVQDNVKISDEKFKTKPTTFLKDAFKRFCKNKASVVGAIILGILLILTILVPIISPYDVGHYDFVEVDGKKTFKYVQHVSSVEGKLAPKLFDVESGIGFWDGTYKKTHIVYDVDNQVPSEYNPNAVLDCKVYEPELVDNANIYGHNGYLVFSTDGQNKANYYLRAYSTKYTANGQYSATINFSDEENYLNGSLAEYRIVLTYNDTLGAEQTLVLKDWSKDFTTQSVNISEAISLAGLTTINSGAFRFEIKPIQNKMTYILIKTVEFSCLESCSNYETFVNEMSIVDATRTVKAVDIYSTDPAKKDYNNPHVWNCNGVEGIHNSELTYCDFRYDSYEDCYGTTYITLSKSELDYYINTLKCCTYDYKAGVSSLVVLTDDCPFDSVISQQLNSITGKLLSVVVESQKYKLTYHYDEMPKYLFGTDAYGCDLVTKAFSGLGTSLILGLCTAAFCFCFGLVWGAISGYFGGNVDLAMERFCEILGGVPWIVVMTLCILHLGNNFLTFFLALCLTGWMGTAARTRTQFYRFKGREYILASRTLGSSDLRLIFKHILPNSMGTIITGSVLMIPSTIFSEATLAYLNLGLQGMQSFGVMMSQNQPFLELYPALVIFPAVIMALMMISFNLFGNGLRDAFNPSLKGSE